METIKFRGLAYSQGWVYGSYIHSKRFAGCSNEHRIFNQETGLESDVIGETVGQYVGLTDKNGKEIYSGDITDKKLVVKWNILHNGWCLFSGGAMKSEMLSDVYDNHGKPVKPYYDCEIIGNIFENKDLINK